MESERPDRVKALAMYARRAPTYRLGPGRLFERQRRMAIRRLDLRPGDAVVDVGCGTGLSIPYLQEGITETGRVIGIEQSGPMLARARALAEENGWQNVTLIEAPVEEAEIPRSVDAALFCYTHDILRTPEAVDRVMAAVKPGGRVAAVGGKFVRWFPPLNSIVRRSMNGAITTFEGLDAPWSHLLRWVPDLRVRPSLFGTLYVAWGRVVRRSD